VVPDMSGRTLGLEPFSRVVDLGSTVEAERVVGGFGAAWGGSPPSCRAGKADMPVPLHSAGRSGCMGKPMWKGRLKR